MPSSREPLGKVARQKREPLDTIQRILIFGSATVALIIVVAHIIFAYNNKADSTVTLLLSLLTLTFTTLFGIYTGRWSQGLSNRKYIVAALRKASRTHAVLQSTEQKIADNIRRLKTRQFASVEVACDFCEAFVEGHIDQLRTLEVMMRDTIDNWRMIDQEGSELMTAAEQDRIKELSDITVAEQGMRTIAQDLSQYFGVADISTIQDRIAQLQKMKERISTESSFAVPETGEARRLLANGAFEEAIRSYTSIIASSPDSHTLYIGRARARFLADDTDGALDDLRIAAEKCPGDATIERMREQIREDRKDMLVMAPDQYEFKNFVARGNRALAAGDGQTALTNFKGAANSGLIQFLAMQDEVMALLLLADFQKADETLQASWTMTYGPFVRIQAHALEAFLLALRGGDNASALKELANSMNELSQSGVDFAITESPLQYLIQGLQRKGMINEKVQAVVDMLRPRPRSDTYAS